MEIGHPPDWELSFACEPDAPGRCSFSDRYYQRMDVRWRELKYVPDLDKMLDKYRIAARYILPYSTQQYNAQMVDWAKANKRCLVLTREIIVWRVG